MGAQTELSTCVTAIAGACQAANEAMLRVGGFLQAPTAHILFEDQDQPYIGWITSRPFYRGADAAVAIAGLGLLPSVLRATHLVITWENEDLCAALELRGEFPRAVVVVVAALIGHTVLWYPLRMHVGPISANGLPTVEAEWGQPSSRSDMALPDPITDLLAEWRKWRDTDTDLNETVIGLQRAGYEIRWIER